MPAEFFSNPANETITGNVSINADARTGEAGNLTVAGATTMTGAVTSAVTSGNALVLNNNTSIAIKDNTGGGTTQVLSHTTTDNTQVRAKVGQTVQLQDQTGLNLATFSAALTNLAGTALQLSGSSTVAAPTGAAQTIATNTGMISRTAPTGACTGAILQAGTQDRQLCIVTNESTTVANTITFSTTLATGNVLTDATPTAVVIKASSMKVFVWFTSLSAWVPTPPAAG